VAIDLLIGAIKAIVILLAVLNLAAILLWFERKGSALIQDRVGANRASITGFGMRMGLPNLGFINTLVADPLKLFTKEDFVPEGADKFLHALGPFLALFPVLVTFAVVPIGDAIEIAGRTSSRVSGSGFMASRSEDGHRTIDGHCSARFARPHK
jgi:NADH-quinone oxidoreductase subunit H